MNPSGVQLSRAGKRNRRMVVSSDQAFTLHPPPGTELTLELAGTSLTLPVVGGRAAWGRAVE